MRISKSGLFSDNMVGSRPSWAVYETLSQNTKAKVNFPNGGGKNNLPRSARCPPPTEEQARKANKSVTIVTRIV